MAEYVVFDLGVLGRELDVGKMQAAIGQEMPFTWNGREMPSRITAVTVEDDRMKVTVEIDGELDWPDRDLAVSSEPKRPGTTG